MPRVSAIPIELSTNPASAMYAGTQHGSLQNADAVITHLTGLLSGSVSTSEAFRKPKAQVALEVEDVYFAGEPVDGARTPEQAATRSSTATLWRSGESQPVATAQMPAASDDWRNAEFAPPAAGAYRVTVTGDRVETAEDSFVVAEIGQTEARSSLRHIRFRGLANRVTPPKGRVRWYTDAPIFTWRPTAAWAGSGPSNSDREARMGGGGVHRCGERGRVLLRLPQSAGACAVFPGRSSRLVSSSGHRQHE